jgi:uncharacterized membrane protein YjfL (UPF0719 family)
METILIAILRKLIFAVVIIGGFIAIDKFYLTGFNTWEVIKDDPKAVAILLGFIVLALAFA